MALCIKGRFSLRQVTGSQALPPMPSLQIWVLKNEVISIPPLISVFADQELLFSLQNMYRSVN